jgi:hypothetical protein
LKVGLERDLDKPLQIVFVWLKVSRKGPVVSHQLELGQRLSFSFVFFLLIVTYLDKHKTPFLGQIIGLSLPS